jgi:hypothetical protein
MQRVDEVPRHLVDENSRRPRLRADGSGRRPRPVLAALDVVTGPSVPFGRISVRRPSPCSTKNSTIVLVTFNTTIASVTATLNDPARSCKPGGFATTFIQPLGTTSGCGAVFAFRRRHVHRARADQIDDSAADEFDLRLAALGDIEDVQLLDPRSQDHFVPGRAAQQLGASLEQRDGAELGRVRPD